MCLCNIRGGKLAGEGELNVPYEKRETFWIPKHFSLTAKIKRYQIRMQECHKYSCAVNIHNEYSWHVCMSPRRPALKNLVSLEKQGACRHSYLGCHSGDKAGFLMTSLSRCVLLKQVMFFSCFTGNSMRQRNGDRHFCQVMLDKDTWLGRLHTIRWRKGDGHSGHVLLHW